MHGPGRKDCPQGENPAEKERCFGNIPQQDRRNRAPATTLIGWRNVPSYGACPWLKALSWTGAWPGPCGYSPQAASGGQSIQSTPNFKLSSFTKGLDDKPAVLVQPPDLCGVQTSNEPSLPLGHPVLPSIVFEPFVDGIQMESSTLVPPTPGRAMRALILLLVKASRHKIARRFLRRQIGLFHISNICIKTKRDENVSEAYAMQFVASRTSIPVPKVYYAFIYKGTSYIVMRHIKGQMAAHGWPGRSEESKTRILEQLRGMVTELRSIPPPEGTRVGSIDGGPFYDCRLPERLYWGPYATVREFHEALTDGIPWDADCTKLPDLAELFAFYRQAEDKMVLTHGDLSSLNILVRGDDVVGIVDWETAGWFPAYWEYTTAKYVNPQNPFWADQVDQFIAPMPEEWKMETIRRKYFGDV